MKKGILALCALWLAAAALAEVPPVVVEDAMVQKYGEEAEMETQKDGLLFWRVDKDTLYVGDGENPGGRPVCVGHMCDHASWTNDVEANGFKLKLNRAYSLQAAASTMAVTFGDNPVLRILGVSDGELAGLDAELVDASTLRLTADAAGDGIVLEVSTNLMDATQFVEVQNATVVEQTEYSTVWDIPLDPANHQFFRVRVNTVREAGIHANLPLYANEGISMDGQGITNWGGLSQWFIPKWVTWYKLGNGDTNETPNIESSGLFSTFLGNYLQFEGSLSVGARGGWSSFFQSYPSLKLFSQNGNVNITAGLDVNVKAQNIDLSPTNGAPTNAQVTVTWNGVTMTNWDDVRGKFLPYAVRELLDAADAPVATNLNSAIARANALWSVIDDAAPGDDSPTPGTSGAGGTQGASPEGPTVGQWIMHEAGHKLVNGGTGGEAGDLRRLEGVSLSTNVPAVNYTNGAPQGRSIALVPTTGGTAAAESADVFDAVAGERAFTVMAWIRRTDPDGTSSSARIVSDISAKTDGSGFEFRATSGGGVALTVNGYTASTSANGIIPANEGVWRHLAATYTNGTFRIYTNAVQVYTTTWQNPEAVGSNSVPFTVGNSSGGRVRESQFIGEIDDVMVFSGVALSQSEIAEWMNTSDAGLIPPRNPGTPEELGEMDPESLLYTSDQVDTLVGNATAEAVGVVATNLAAHVADNSNPHSVTAQQTGAIPEWPGWYELDASKRKSVMKEGIGWYKVNRIDAPKQLAVFSGTNQMLLRSTAEDGIVLKASTYDEEDDEETPGPILMDGVVTATGDVKAGSLTLGTNTWDHFPDMTLYASNADVSAVSGRVSSIEADYASTGYVSNAVAPLATTQAVASVERRLESLEVPDTMVLWWTTNLATGGRYWVPTNFPTRRLVIRLDRSNLSDVMLYVDSNWDPGRNVEIDILSYASANGTNTVRVRNGMASGSENHIFSSSATGTNSRMVVLDFDEATGEWMLDSWAVNETAANIGYAMSGGTKRAPTGPATVEEWEALRQTRMSLSQ